MKQNVFTLYNNMVSLSLFEISLLTVDGAELSWRVTKELLLMYIQNEPSGSQQCS